MNTHREKITKALTLRQQNEELLAANQSSQAALRQQLIEADSTLAIARKAAGLVQDSLATKLSGIVTKALGTVFEEPIEFIARFVERRGVSECDLLVKVNGEEYDILKEDGGGMADVCSTALQMAFILLSPVDRVLVADELARHVGRGDQGRFAAVLKDLCTELDFTVVTVTHAAAFQEIADKVFSVTKKGGISYVKENS